MYPFRYRLEGASDVIAAKSCIFSDWLVHLISVPSQSPSLHHLLSAANGLIPTTKWPRKTVIAYFRYKQTMISDHWLHEESYYTGKESTASHPNGSKPHCELFNPSIGLWNHHKSVRESRARLQSSGKKLRWKRSTRHVRTCTTPLAWKIWAGQTRSRTKSIFFW